MRIILTILLSFFLLAKYSLGQIPFHKTDIEERDLIGKVHIVKETTSSFLSKNDIRYSAFTVFDERGYTLKDWTTFKEDTTYENYIISFDTMNGIITKSLIQKDDTLIVFKAFLDSVSRVKEIIKYYSFTEGCSQMYSFYTNDGGTDLIYKEKYDFSDTTGVSNASFVLRDDKWVEREIFASPTIKNRIRKNRKVIYEYYPGKRNKYIIKYKEYDSYGNWTKYEKYYKRKPISITERMIEYY